MVEISISRCFDNGMDANKFLKEIVLKFEELGVCFDYSDFYVTPNYITFVDKKSQSKVKLQLFEACSNEFYFGASATLYADQFKDFNRIISFIENLAETIPDCGLNAFMAKHDGQKFTRFVVYFDNDKNTLSSYDKIHPFIKKKIGEKVLVVYKEEEILCEKTSSSLKPDGEFILREIGTGHEFSTHLDISKYDCNCDSSYYLHCGKGYRRFTASAWGKDIDDTFEKFSKRLLERGYEIVKFPKVKNES